MIVVVTSSPKKLLRLIREAIEQSAIETWSYDSDGDFTHSPPQWVHRAWLRPQLLAGRLNLTIVAPQGAPITSPAYAVYHGRFIEMLLAHFDGHFERAWATALPDGDDLIE